MKIIQKIRLWLIKKLNAIPRDEFKRNIIISEVRPITISATCTIDQDLFACDIENYYYEIKKQIIEKMIPLLQENCKYYTMKDYFAEPYPGLTFRGELKIVPLQESNLTVESVKNNIERERRADSIHHYSSLI